ncbi:MAG: translesion error-prone DNA polymerase V autoproteolytic subunit [Chlamydiota bacterium]
MGHGGKRVGSGRPKHSGRYKEPTRAIRLPISIIEKLKRSDSNQIVTFPLYQNTVAAGFPSPAEGEKECDLDLHELLIKHPAATFFVRVSGSSMIQAGIHHGDMLIVDRSVEPVHGKIVIAALNGELVVKRLFREGKRTQLVSENEEYAPIEIGEGEGLHIWGVVTSVIHAV